jgi:RNA polymerase sigma-70 factor (ECF subfamily)
LLDTVLEGATSVLGSLFTGGTEQPDPEAQACESEQAGQLLQCLHALPEKFRLVVLLCDVEELGHEEVASILEIPVGTVKSRHFRGRAQLSTAFKALQAELPHEVSEEEEEDLRELARRS